MPAIAAKMTVAQKRIAYVKMMAADAFSTHEIREVTDGGPARLWECERPGSRIYGFRVTVVPGSIFLTGDLGVLVVQRQEDMIDWARAAINDIGYFAEKVSSEISTRDFDPARVTEWLELERAETDDPSDELQEAWNGLAESLRRGVSEHEIQSALVETPPLYHCDFPDFTNWKHSFLWQREAIAWWLQNLVGKNVPNLRADS